MLGTDRDDPVFTRDRDFETRTSADVTATANGTLFKLPAGNAGATLRVGGTTVGLDGERRSEGETTSNSLSRTSESSRQRRSTSAAISRRNREFSALG